VPHASNWCRAGSEVRIVSDLDKPVGPLFSSLGLDRYSAHIGGARSLRTVDATDGPYADLSEAQHEQSRQGSQDLPISLRGLRVVRPNQVWCANVTDLPIWRGFLYLVAIMDRYTRKVLAWRISNTLEAGFYVYALNEALHKYGLPEIMNTARAASSHLLRGQIRYGDLTCASP